MIVLPVILLVIVILTIIKLTHLKHKVYAVAIVLLLLFFYLSGSYIVEEKNIDLSTGEGILKAGGVYLGWIGHIFSNAKSLTGQAIKMDWKGDLGENKTKG